SRNSAVLCQAGDKPQNPEKTNTEWHEKQLSIHDEIQHQHQLFNQHQLCLFIEEHWLASIEQSFLRLTEKLEQLRTKIGG
ncbi:DUF3763 domain-containing protein, partial [Xenorhabdus bovienii]|uniref:ATPase RavA domain-containing protein n=1 Tax=Xenorhabdus bovienii TaxID=40576 RepID=UPI0023B24EEB